MGIAVEVASGIPAADQVVGGAQGAGGAEIGSRNDGGGRVADRHKPLMLHSLLGNEVHIPSGGIVLRVVESVGVDKMGVNTAQGLRFGVHLPNKGGHGTGDGFRQNMAGLIGGDQHHAVQQVLHSQNLAGLNIGGAAVAG